MITAQPQLFATHARSASFDRGRIYRYTLWRRWSAGDRYVNFIGLNPSTADESADDPTSRKLVKFARLWGFDALCITNLFAYRATSPRDMMSAADPIGYGNDRRLSEIAKDASLIVCAWGRDGAFSGRGAAVKRLLSKFDLNYLRITQGQPWHPLYLPDNTKPSRWLRRDR
jgi:hypothetical protein